MYEILQNIGIRKIAIISSLLVLVLLVLTVLSGGVIVIENSSSNGEVKGTINRLDSSEDEKLINLNSFMGNIVFLRRGVYSFNFEQQRNDLSTTYQQEVRGFSLSTIKVTFSKQKNAKAIGYSELGCSYYDKDHSQDIYYNCPENNVIGGEMTLSTDGGNNSVPLATYDPLTFYMGGVIGFSTGEEDDSSPAKLEAGQIQNNQLVPGESLVIKKELLTENSIITDLSSKLNSRFIFYNEAARKLTVFQDMKDNGPTDIKISEYIKKTSNNYTTKVALSDKYIFVFSGINPELEMGDGHKIKNDSVEQSLFVFDSTSGSLVKKFEIDDGMRVKNMQSNGLGEVALTGNNEKGIGHLLAYSSEKQSIRASIADNITDMGFCYIGKEVYFKANGGGVYTYKPSTASSYLIYDTPIGSVVSVSCLYNDIYIATSGDEGLYDGLSYKHLFLEKSEYNPSNLRPESLFPISGGDEDISLADLYLNKVSIKLNQSLEDIAKGACTVSDKKRKEIINYFKNKGVETSKLVFDISYQCQSATGGSSETPYDLPQH